MTGSYGLTNDAALAALAASVDYAHAAAVPGDVVEFGCFAGRSAQALAASIAASASDYSNTDKLHGLAPRRLWVLDSFLGLPDAELDGDRDSPHVRAGVWRWRVDEDKSAPLAEAVAQMCRDHLPPDQVMVVPGWFRDTLHLIPPETRFAVVHVDCDLYESTSDVLQYLVAHCMFSDGCSLLFDDWYCNRGNPRFGEQRAWSEIKHALDFTDWGPYGNLGRRFIVHGRT